MSLRPLAVVTGGSSGIGFELARQFAEHGYDLLIAAENQGHLVEAAQALRGLGPSGASEVETLAVDLSTFGGTQMLYERIKAGGRPVDALAANAGVGVGGDFVRETPLQDELRMIALNINHVVHLVKLVGRDMVERGQGRILITSSIAGVMPGPREAVYAATKAFLLSFSEAIRNELKDTGVTVTALQPGPTETNFFERAGLDDTRVGQSDMKSDPADVAKEGFEALMAGKDHVVAGVMNKVQTGMAALMPDKGKAAVHGEMTKPAS
ncbi:MAG TPA: SDR family NAD(P)-dependent oxidoreductase [Caulobacteraceae bacterium]|nr:SDR family NAD(P)-dependent oxidoreductase [Caulobacteraceae bacterium]